MKVSSSIPQNSDGSIDCKVWLDQLSRQYQEEHVNLIRSAAEFCHTNGVDLASAYAASVYTQGLIMAAILAELKADHEAVIAAMLYELGNQKPELIKTIENQFGSNIVHIITSAKSLPIAQAVQTGAKLQNEQAERYRKMILAIVNDIRVVLVKLAECLCIMRALKGLLPKERKLLALEVMNIYAPLANRLGIGQIKWELEDRAFASLQPQVYHQISECLHEKRVDRERYIESLKADLSHCLKAAGIKAELSGRAKHIYSIWRKMQKKHLHFEMLFDIHALRILVPDISSCYEALSCVHELWPPAASGFRDYISSPKPNGYQSIHSIVNGPEQKCIEVQIRTYAMHEESEKGVAAHWRYKEGSQRNTKLENRINWLRSLLEWQKELGAENGEARNIHNQLLDEQIYVFTPQGEVIDLPKGATVLDFAYRIHTEIGHRCQGAKINSKLVPLNTVLKTTDRVEIILGKEIKPNRDWLRRENAYITTPQARRKVLHWFRQQEPTYSIDEAADEPEDSSPVFEINIHQPKKLNFDDVIVYGVDNLLTRAAGCCRPIMGDAILGYITQGRGITVHREDCQVIHNIKPEHTDRLIAVKWGNNPKAAYPVDLSIYAQNRSDMLRDLTQLFAQESISILSLQTTIDQAHNVLIAYVLIEIKNTEQMQRILSLLKQVKGVLEVKRGR